jgi:porin
MFFCFVVALIATPNSFGQDSALKDRDYLFGDWGGMRTRLADHGVEFELIGTGEYMNNFDGGMDEGDDFRWDTSLTITLDTEAAGWWENGEFFVHLQAQGGDGITEEYVGDFQVLSNIDADDYEQVSEFWYKHSFMDGRLTLKLGKMEANEDFAFVDYGGEFLNSSPDFSPTIPLVTFPDQDWGAVLGLEVNDWFSIHIGAYQARIDGGRSIGNTIDSLYGPMLMVEPSFHYDVDGKPGTFRIGAWWNGDDAESLDGMDSDETSGLYFTWDQLLYAENPADKEDEQGLGVFGQLGFSDDEYYEAEAYYGAGLQWAGPCDSRDADIIGLGIFHVELSDDGGFDADSETAFELFYKLQCTPWFSIKPEIQYIVNPGGTDNGDALVGGFRTEISF